MTDAQTNKLNMYLAVHRVCDQHRDVWTTLPIAVTVFDDFEARLAQLQDAARLQAEATTGTTENKTAARDRMADAAVVLGQTLATYADLTDDPELRTRVDRNPSDFTRAKAVEARDLAETILQEGQTLLLQLADYGVTQEQLDALDAAIDAYAEVIAAPRTAITRRSQLTRAIVDHIAALDGLLRDRLDRLMLQFKDTSFYGEYRGARTIVDLVST